MRERDRIQVEPVPIRDKKKAWNRVMINKEPVNMHRKGRKKSAQAVIRKMGGRPRLNRSHSNGSWSNGA